MMQISQIDSIVQQLDNLSLAELQKIKSKVDDLINNKIGTQDIKSLVEGWAQFYSLSMDVANYKQDIKSFIEGRVVPPPVAVGISSLKYCRISPYSNFCCTYPSFLKDDRTEIIDKKKSIDLTLSTVPATGILLSNKGETDSHMENTPKKNLIHLVNEWMGDESGYDEETYPQLEAALNKSQ